MMLFRSITTAFLVLLVLTTAPARAVNPDERLTDPGLEARARALSKELRCMVCQNESIDDSNADLAHDLRVIVRQRLSAGDSDQQVLAYMRARYGDFVLLQPPVDRATWVLWFGPFAILLLGAAGIGLATRFRHAAPPAAPLSEEEARHLQTLLNSEPDPS
jgi:cytochrome c-type biogenesis protein CcmH